MLVTLHALHLGKLILPPYSVSGKYADSVRPGACVTAAARPVGDAYCGAYGSSMCMATLCIHHAQSAQIFSADCHAFCMTNYNYTP